MDTRVIGLYNVYKKCNMITNKELLHLYLDSDKFALGKNRPFPLPYIDSIWRYQRLLRYYEYHRNVGNKIRRCWYSLLLRRLGERLGFDIPGNVFGLGLRINHYGMLIVNSNAKVGKWCDINQGVNIGANGLIDDEGKIHLRVPIIGNYCYIGIGATIFNNCKIGDNVRIGANSVIMKDVPNDMTVYGLSMQMHHHRHKMLCISSPEFEQLFLTKYPQYKELIKSIE